MHQRAVIGTSHIGSPPTLADVVGQTGIDRRLQSASGIRATDIAPVDESGAQIDIQADGIADTEIVENTQTCGILVLETDLPKIEGPEYAHMNIRYKLIYAVTGITGYGIGEIPKEIIVYIIVTCRQFVGFHSPEGNGNRQAMTGLLDIFGECTALNAETKTEFRREPFAESELDIPFHLAVEERLIVFRQHRSTTSERDKEIVPNGIYLIFLFLRTGKRGRKEQNPR